MGEFIGANCRFPGLTCKVRHRVLNNQGDHAILTGHAAEPDLSGPIQLNTIASLYDGPYRSYSSDSQRSDGNVFVRKNMRIWPRSFKAAIEPG